MQIRWLIRQVDGWDGWPKKEKVLQYSQLVSVPGENMGQTYIWIDVPTIKEGEE